mgnify:CR=1 FL=1
MATWVLFAIAATIAVTAGLTVILKRVNGAGAQKRDGGED